MSKQLIFSLAVEFWLVALTVIFLTQPSFIFRSKTEQTSSKLMVSGYFMLCVTFCWSVVVGCVIAFQQMLQEF